MAVERVWQRIMTAGALAGVCTLVGAAPPSAAPASASSAASLQAQARDVDARLAAARTRHADLEKEVADMEQHNAARRAQLDERDDQIAVLRRKLDAAGAPASAGSPRR